MLTPEQIVALRDRAAQITDPINDYLIEEIARRISEAGQLTSTAAYQVWRAQQLGVSQREIKKRLRKLLQVSHKELSQLLTQAAEVGYDFDIKHLPYVKAVPFHKNETLQQIVAAAVELAQEDFTNLTQTLGMVDPYGNALPLQDAYRSCTDYAFKQVITGAADYNTAIRRATKNLAEKSIRVIDYESGVHTSLEAAVRRNIMGGLGLMQEQIAQVNHDQLGADGWEISAHANSAPDHEPIQGKQYSDAEYQALNNSLVRRIGTLNCGHAAFPIILGVSSPQYTSEELEKFRADNENGITVDGKHYTGYEATQMQRKLERSIRAQKRRVLVAEASGDKDTLAIAKTNLQRLRQEYTRFSKASGLRTQQERLEVAGFGPKQAGTVETNANLTTAQIGNAGEEKFDPSIAKRRLLKILEGSGGLKDNISMLRYYAENTDYVADARMPGPVAYDRSTDVVRYNPAYYIPDGADIGGILAHEIAHRADCLIYVSENDKRWNTAIQRVRQIFSARTDEVEAWFGEGGKYDGDPFLSDIMSAVFQDSINIPYGHSVDYWKRPGNIEREIFANMCAIDAIGSAGKQEFSKTLVELYSVFKEILEG